MIPSYTILRYIWYISRYTCGEKIKLKIYQVYLETYVLPQSYTLEEYNSSYTQDIPV